MLRITVRHDVNSIALMLEGKLAGDWVHELRTVWTTVQAIQGKDPIVVRLSEISGVDVPGRRLLSEIHSAGAVLTGSGLLARTLIEEITGIHHS
jgi:hypothetical protein